MMKYKGNIYDEIRFFIRLPANNFSARKIEEMQFRIFCDTVSYFNVERWLNPTSKSLL